MSGQSGRRRGNESEFPTSRSLNNDRRKSRHHSGGSFHQGGGGSRHRHESGGVRVEIPPPPTGDCYHDGLPNYDHPVSRSTVNRSPHGGIFTGGVGGDGSAYQLGYLGHPTEALSPDTIYGWIKREQDKYQRAKEDNDVLNRELRRLRDDNKTLADENDKLRMELYELERERNSKYEQMKAKFDKAEAQMSEDGKKLKATVREKQEKIGSLHRLVTRLNERNARNTKEEHERHQVERKLKEANAKLAEDKERLSEENAKLQETLAEKTRRIEKLEGETLKRQESAVQLVKSLNERIGDEESKVMLSLNAYRSQISKVLEDYVQDMNACGSAPGGSVEENKESALVIESGSENEEGPGGNLTSPALSTISSVIIVSPGGSRQPGGTSRKRGGNQEESSEGHGGTNSSKRCRPDGREMDSCSDEVDSLDPTVNEEEVEAITVRSSSDSSDLDTDPETIAVKREPVEN